jgi:hypothetical protein
MNVNQALGGTGQVTLAGDLLPSISDTFSLGSQGYIWKDLWVGTGSIHIGPTGVFSADANGIITTSKLQVSNNLFSSAIKKSSQALGNIDLSDNFIQINSIFTSNVGGLNPTTNQSKIIINYENIDINNSYISGGVTPTTNLNKINISATGIQYILNSNTGNTGNQLINIGNGFVNWASNIVPTNSLDPNGIEGQIAYNSDFLYIKTSAEWRRVALSSFP